MATFKSEKFIPTNMKDLSAVANTVKEYFESKGYTVSMEDNAMGCFISLNKGGMFKAVLGMKTALNIEIRTLTGGVAANAKVGIFGQQLVPSMISLFVAWPVLVTQITGLVSQSKLDDEALEVIEKSIHSLEAGENVTVNSASAFCTSCGSALKPGSRFCSECGAKQ